MITMKFHKSVQLLGTASPCSTSNVATSSHVTRQMQLRWQRYTNTVRVSGDMAGVSVPAAINDTCPFKCLFPSSTVTISSSDNEPRSENLAKCEVLNKLQVDRSSWCELFVK